MYHLYHFLRKYKELKAFENYDLTFLAHASVEKNLSLTDHWLEQVGVSTHSLMSTRVGRR